MESSTKLLTLKEQAVGQLQSTIDPDSEVRLMTHTSHTPTHSFSLGFWFHFHMQMEIRVEFWSDILS